jgi:DNA-binding IclR family transcriptional regulator
MARPALSATRATAILDLLTAYPERTFTMAEIIRATKINIASCHSLLNALADSGYLTRIRGEKGYVLGPALVAVGQSALKAHSLIARSEFVAQEISDRLGVGFVLNTISSEETLALIARAGPNGRDPGIRPGQRMPLIPPAGAHFVAWASPEAVESWIGRAGESSKAEIEQWRHNLALIRERGFQVTLRGSKSGEFGKMMAEMAAGRPALDFNRRIAHSIHSHDWLLEQPEEIEENELYDVTMIAAPIFDKLGDPVLSLNLSGFAERLSGSQIREFAGHLVEGCLRVMREDRSG